MPLIFSYGTLQQESVQLANFGRLLKGATDTLVGFSEARVPIKDQALIAASGQTHHANAAYTGNLQNQVAGTAFEVTDEELVMADDYEKSADYTRVSVRLASGQRAWVYVHAPGAPSSTVKDGNRDFHDTVNRNQNENENENDE